MPREQKLSLRFGEAPGVDMSPWLGAFNTTVWRKDTRRQRGLAPVASTEND